MIGIETPEGRIAATLAEPFGAPPEAVAVLLHGYTGTRDEIPVAGGEGLFARTARAFAERGIASLRIDFRGSRASGRAWADTTLDGQARDAIAARDFLAGHLRYSGRPRWRCSATAKAASWPCAPGPPSTASRCGTRFSTRRRPMG